MAVQFQVTFDAADPEALGRFWAAMLGYTEQEPPPGFDNWPDALRAFGFSEEDIQGGSAYAVVDPEGVGPRVFLQKVPESKTAKNRVHLDLNVGAEFARGPERRAKVLAEVERAVGLGATRVREVEEPGDGFCVVLLDPEGNEFCLQ